MKCNATSSIHLALLYELLVLSDDLLPETIALFFSDLGIFRIYLQNNRLYDVFNSFFFFYRKMTDVHWNVNSKWHFKRFQPLNVPICVTTTPKLIYFGDAIIQWWKLNLLRINSYKFTSNIQLFDGKSMKIKNSSTFNRRTANNLFDSWRRFGTITWTIKYEISKL